RREVRGQAGRDPEPSLVMIDVQVAEGRRAGPGFHTRASNRRADALHKLSARLVDACEVLVVEDLPVTGMTNDRHIAMSVTDAAMAELARQIGYKATWND